MKVLTVLDAAKIVIADLEVDLGGKKRHAPTLCVLLKDQVVPLNTLDGRPILMNMDNAIPL